MRIRHVAAGIAAAALGAPVCAQTGLSVRAENGANTVVNPLPIAVVVQAVNAGTSTTETAFVPAQGSSPLRKLRGAARLSAYEAIDVRVPRLSAVNSTCLDQAPGIDSNTVRAALDDASLSESPEAAEKIRIARELAAVDLEARLDARETQRDQEELAASKASIASGQYVAAPNHGLEDTLGEAMDYAVAFGDVEDAKLDVIADELSVLEDLSEQVKSRLDARRREVRDAQAVAAAGREFVEGAEKALRASLAPSAAASLPSGARVTRPPSRTCNGPAAVRDAVVMSLTGAERAVVFGTVDFGRDGGRQRTFFRRLGTTDLWAATIYWPPAATEAVFRLDGLSGSAGTVPVGRASLEEELRRAERAGREIEKAVKTAKFREAGGDRIKTMRIP
jgi:hypothetical protein